MASAVIKLSALLLLVAVVAANVSVQGSAPSQPVSDVCLDCICQTLSGCKQSTQCVGDACGLFYITRGYWVDAGKPTLYGQSPDESEAFRSCTMDSYCAALTVQGYMRRFAQDCNGDGHIDCNDYMAIHTKGGYKCTGKLPKDRENRFNQCLSAAGGL